jgi:hypothetical protein
MKITTIIAPLAFALVANVAVAGQWEECRDNVESFLYAGGNCGASACYIEHNGQWMNQGEYTALQCGWPEHTAAERAELIEYAIEVENCTLSDGKLDCNGVQAQRALNWYAPSDPIHKQLSDAIWASKR